MWNQIRVKKSNSSEKNIKNTPNFLSFGQKIKSRKRNRYSSRNKLKKSKNSPTSLNSSPSFHTSSISPLSLSVNEQHKTENSMKNNILNQFSSWSTPPPPQSWSFKTPTPSWSSPTPHSHYLEEIYKDSSSPRKMDFVDVDDRGRHMLNFDEPSKETDDIGLIDYTNDDNIKKPFSIGFQPPAFW